MQSVLSLVLVVIGDDDAASGKSLLGLGVSQLGDGQGGGDGHDAGGDQSLAVQTKTNVTDEDGTGNGGETTGHDLVDLGLGHVRDEGPDQHGRFTLADERGGSSDDSFGTRDSKSPEDEHGKLDNEPLQEVKVVQDLDDGDEEDDGRDDTEEEHALVGGFCVGQEGNTVFGEAQEVGGAVGNEAEDVVSDTSAQDEDADDVLGQHAANNSAPVDLAAIPASGPEESDEDQHTEETDGTVLAGVVLLLLRDERTNKDGTNGDGSAGGSSHLGGDLVVNDDGGVVPDPANGVGDVAARDVEEEEAQHDAEPHQERDDPVPVVVVEDQRGDPPAGEEHADEQVDQDAAVTVQRSQLSTTGLRAMVVGRGDEAGLHFLVVAVVGGSVGGVSAVGELELLVVLQVLGRLNVVLVEMALGRHGGGIGGGSGGVDGIVVAIGINARRVVMMLVAMLVGGIESGIRVTAQALGGGGSVCHGDD